jgi:hypothetical protein
MFCNQHHPNHSGDKLWAEMFQTSLVTQSLVLFSLAIRELCDECHRHLSSLCCNLNSMRTWSPFSLFSRQIHPCTIYPCSCYTYLVIPQRFLPSTSIFSGVIVPCYFWWVICFSPIKSLSSKSRDEILFRGEGCDSPYTCNARHIFVSVKLCLWV